VTQIVYVATTISLRLVISIAVQDRRMVITNSVQETAHARSIGHAADDVTSAPKVQRCDQFRVHVSIIVHD